MQHLASTTPAVDGIPNWTALWRQTASGDVMNVFQKSRRVCCYAATSFPDIPKLVFCALAKYCPGDLMDNGIPLSL